MLTMLWNLSAAIRGYLRCYLPTNRAVDWLRTPRGRKWAIPVALVATPSYLHGMSISATVVDRGGPGYLNLLVLLFFWNASKFAWLALLTLILDARLVLAFPQARSLQSGGHRAAIPRSSERDLGSSVFADDGRRRRGDTGRPDQTHRIGLRPHGAHLAGRELPRSAEE